VLIADRGIFNDNEARVRGGTLDTLRGKPKTERNKAQPFWVSKSLDQLDGDEWEALCDGCGRCCLNKLEDDDTGEIHLTRLACRLLDLGTCQCSDYENRQERVPECVKIDAEAVRTVKWLPPTCAYRLVAEGRPLAWWHPLVSGTQQTVHDAGISVRGLARSEKGVKIDDYWKYIIEPFE
jgi:uncharacterized cysteine cluster protein YcgN (CxxCxxCC family)